MKPVLIGATGTVLKSLTQNLSKIPGRHEIKEVQKIAILCTAHILREMLYCALHTYCGKCWCGSSKHISRAK
jgi:hypothetical protein